MAALDTGQTLLLEVLKVYNSITHSDDAAMTV